MITKFKIFEELKIGYNIVEGVPGSFIRDYGNNERCRRITIPNILKFLKEKHIKYYLFYKKESDVDYFIFLFPNMKKDKGKFPKNKYSDKSYLPSIDENGEEIDFYNIKNMFKDNIDGWIDITSIKNIEELESIIQANKYNL